MKNSIKPRNSLVLIRALAKDEQQTAAGIIIPKLAGQVFEPAEILEVGRGTPECDFRDANDLMAGMRVLACIGTKGAGLGDSVQYSALPMNDMKNVFLLNQSDIFAILEEPKGGWPSTEQVEKSTDQPGSSGLVIAK